MSHDRHNVPHETMKLDEMTIYVMSHVIYYVTSQAMHVKDLAMHASYRPNDLTN